MAKKVRLNINYSEITKKNIEVVADLEKKNLDGRIFIHNGTVHYNLEGTDLYFILAGLHSWLTEIKEPLTKQEAWEDCKESIKEEIFKSQGWYFYKGWDLCLENQKICDSPDIARYQGAVDVGEWIDLNKHRAIIVSDHNMWTDSDIIKAWNAALRGFSNKEK